MAKEDSTTPQIQGVYWIVCLPTGDSHGRAMVAPHNPPYVQSNEAS